MDKKTPMKTERIPIVVGVTGHRDILLEDTNKLKALVKQGLTDVQNLCKSYSIGEEETPIIMLNGLAQGADMLCAEVAFDMNIPVYAVLPCEMEIYEKSFDSEEVPKFREYVKKSEKVIMAPDTEKFNESEQINLCGKKTSYEYRQLGIYIAEHSHILISLWNGDEPTGKYGCGTAEVVKFALEHSFLGKDKLPVSGTVNDTVIMWIAANRQKEVGKKPYVEPKKLYRIKNVDSLAKGSNASRYSDYETIPDFMQDIIGRTICYNEETKHSTLSAYPLYETKDGEELNQIENALQTNYLKADRLAGYYQKRYRSFMCALSVLGALLTATFLLYDDCGLPWLIYPCFLFILVSGISLVISSSRFFSFFEGKSNKAKRKKLKGYHAKYIEYRAFAETLRTQFYLEACGVNLFACDNFSWSQKNDMVWIEKALRAINVVYFGEKKQLNLSTIKQKWIYEQYSYHTKKKTQRSSKAEKYNVILDVLKIITIVLYSVILCLEILLLFGLVQWWDGTGPLDLPWRNIGIISVGIFAAVTLFISSYFGKLSEERKSKDHEKMQKLYIYALENWDNIAEDRQVFEKFVAAVAREELVENGIWYSYVNENGLQMNI